MNKNRNLFTCTLLIVMLVPSFIFSCKKEKEETDPVENIQTPSGGYGCSLLSMLDDEANPQYEFTYQDGTNLLTTIQQFNSNNGNVQYSYRLGYTYVMDIPGYVLDTVYFYLGDFNNMWYECTIYDYTWITPSTYVIETANVFTQAEGYPDDRQPKGNIIYDFDDYDLLTGIQYFDIQDEDNGNIIDEYRIVYLHDTDERLREMHYYNYNDVETYSEVITPSSHYQSGALSKLVHPEFSWLSRFAPSVVTYYTQGIGTYTYNYDYQVNAQNFVLEQSITDFDPPQLVSLFNWQCN